MFFILPPVTMFKYWYLLPRLTVIWKIKQCFLYHWKSIKNTLKWKEEESKLKVFVSTNPDQPVVQVFISFSKKLTSAQEREPQTEYSQSFMFMQESSAERWRAWA